MLKDRKILIGITGSIAAYKVIELVRLLIKAGAEVKVILTPAATQFVSPLVLSTLSKNTVLTEMFTESGWSNHVMLGRWADVMVIAPASCNTLSSMASGRCDNLLLAVYLSAVCQILCVPAMDEDMWMHPATKRNLEQLRTDGNTIMDVGVGDLASGLNGSGRMAEPQDIFNAIESLLTTNNSLLQKKVLITAGPTYEKIDPVRFIGNFSTGKMGFALAEAFANRGADVTLVAGPVNIQAHHPNIHRIDVSSASEMHKEVAARFPDSDVCIMSAAVADYRPSEFSETKIKKQGDSLNLMLEKNADILSEMGKQKKDSQILVGFALETNNEEAYAMQKLKNKNADYIVLNSLQSAGAGFGYDTNNITIFNRSGRMYTSGIKSKKEIASEIANIISQHL